MPGPKRKIFRGGYEENHPQQMEYILDTSGTLPGDLLAVTAGADPHFVKAGTQGYQYIANAPPCMDPLTYAYAVGETAFGYVPRSRDVFLMRAIAGLTCAKDAPLYNNGSGKITAVATGNIIGYSHFPITVATALNDLIDVRIK